MDKDMELMFVRVFSMELAKQLAMTYSPEEWINSKKSYTITFPVPEDWADGFKNVSKMTNGVWTPEDILKGFLFFIMGDNFNKTDYSKLKKENQEGLKIFKKILAKNGKKMEDYTWKS